MYTYQRYLHDLILQRTNDNTGNVVNETYLSPTLGRLVYLRKNCGERVFFRGSPVSRIMDVRDQCLHALRVWRAVDQGKAEMLLTRVDPMDHFSSNESIIFVYLCTKMPRGQEMISVYNTTSPVCQ